VPPSPPDPIENASAIAEASVVVIREWVGTGKLQLLSLATPGAGERLRTAGMHAELLERTTPRNRNDVL
jgi:hypothetical protein